MVNIYPDKTTRKTAIYARVSTIDQNPKLQIEELIEFVKRNKDWELTQIYEDKITGVKESRPELDHLLRDARSGMFNHIVFWKVSRLGRSALHTYQIVEEWKRLGITFSVMTLGVDTNTASGKFIFSIMAQFAELERENIVEQTNLAMKYIKKQLKKNGKYKTKEGKIITKLGRPKGKKDKIPRKKRGYYLRDRKKKSKKRSPAQIIENDKVEQKI